MTYLNQLEENINSLIAHNENFVLFKEQESNEIKAIVGQQAQTYQDLNEIKQQAFIMNPFLLNKDHKGIYFEYSKLYTIKELNEYCAKIKDTAINSNVKTCLIKQLDTTDRYKQAFNQFMQALLAKQFEKLVLAACTQYKLTISIGKLFINAYHKYPNAFIYLIHTPSSGTWFGATPELLANIKEGKLTTMSLAGTMPKQEGKDLNSYIWSSKDQQEQALVTKYIKQQLNKLGILIQEQGPITKEAGNLVHLQTMLKYQLSSKEAVIEAIKTLHPTPAVCGLPKDQAQAFILEHENLERSYYTGFLGLFDPNVLVSKLYVNLRSMHICKDQAYLFAGGGILSASQLDKELQEVNHKINTMKSLFNAI